MAKDGITAHMLLQYSDKSLVLVNLILLAPHPTTKQRRMTELMTVKKQKNF